MKKILSTFFALLVFSAFLLLPAGMSAYNSMMSMHHGEGGVPCLEHCLGFIDYSVGITVGGIFETALEVLVQKIFLSELILFVIPLTSLYLITHYSPPNLLRKIKNYTYSDLRGIVIATT